MRPPPLLFVHGALGDARVWGPVIDALPAGTDARAITLSGFGSGGHGGDAADFGTARHCRDIADYVAAAMQPPVVLVAWSYGAHPALLAALQRPDLFATLLLYEPGVASFVEDEAQRAPYLADATSCYAPVAEALERGEAAGAAALFGSVGGAGFLQSLPEARRQIALQNAHTLPLMMDGGQKPQKVTAAQAAQLAMPVICAAGTEARPTFAIPARTLAALAPQGQFAEVAGADHMLPEREPERFAGLVMQWIEKTGSGS